LSPAAVGWAVGGAGSAADGVFVAAHCGALLIGKAGQVLDQPVNVVLVPGNFGLADPDGFDLDFFFFAVLVLHGDLAGGSLTRVNWTTELGMVIFSVVVWSFAVWGGLVKAGLSSARVRVVVARMRAVVATPRKVVRQVLGFMAESFWLEEA